MLCTAAPSPQAQHHLTDLFHPQAKNTQALQSVGMKSSLDLSALSISLSLFLLECFMLSSVPFSALLLNGLFFFSLFHGAELAFSKAVYTGTPAAVSNSKTVSLFSHHPDTIFLGIIQNHFP